MGLFRIIKAVREEKKRMNELINMNVEDLSQLSHQDLYEALSVRILEEESNKEVDECLQEFLGAKRLFYVIDYFDKEIQNGGLCQFFVNSSRMVAPYVLEYLDIIQANSYKKLFTDFISKNDISLNHLDSFIIQDIEEYEEQLERYPFDDFDDAYYELYEKEPLDQLLIQYVKNHLEDF